MSLAGLLCTLVQDAPNRLLLGALFLLNMLAMLAVIRLLIARNLATRIRQITEVMNKAAEGELGERVAFEGETEMSLLADNFNSMMEKLSGAINKFHSSVAELKNISVTIGTLSEKGVSSAESQSGYLKQTAAAIREIDVSISNVSESVVNLVTMSSSNSSSMTEMSSSLVTTTTHLESLVSSVEEVSSSVIEMASAVGHIRENAAILANDTGKTAHLVSEMDSAIKHIGTQAADTSRIAEMVKSDAEQGWKAVDATIAGMNEIKSSSAVTFDAIENLSKRVANIGKILSVIDEVAEQTNLLALNASIIAAQAGERGKGFSVVAGEIKELAKRTGNHTREISEIILGVREETERAVKAITLSEKRISEGNILSRQSGEALLKIVNGIQSASSQMEEINKTALGQMEASAAMQHAMGRVAEMVEQIAHATREQSHGNELITFAVGQMRNITHEVMQSISSHRHSAETVIGSNDKINSTVVDICEASILQASCAEQIHGCLQSFEGSADAHISSTMIMDEVLLKLSHQIDSLQKEVEQFATK